MAEISTANDSDPSITQDPYGAARLIKRLIREQGAAYWRAYLVSFVLMAIAAAATAASTYLLKDVVNAAYRDRDLTTIIWLSVAIAVIFTIRGAATYGHLVNLSRIANAILARNQRQL